MFCSIRNSKQLLFWQKFDFSSNFGSILQKDRKGEDRLGYSDPMGITSAPATVRSGKRHHVRMCEHAAAYLPASPSYMDSQDSFPSSLEHQRGRRHIFHRPRVRECRRPSLAKYTPLAPSLAKLNLPSSPPPPCEPSARPGELSRLSSRLDSLFFSNSSHPTHREPFLVVRPSQEVSSCGNQC